MIAVDIADAAFLFTDIEGSTALWQQQPRAMHEAVAAHDAIVRAAIARHGGRVVKGRGDGFHAAFDAPDAAVRAMLDLQHALTDAKATAGVPLRVRSGVHCGESWRRDDDYFGPEVNRAARIVDVAHGGQMLVSQAAASQLDACLPVGVSLRDLGRVRLRDLQRAQHLYQVVDAALRADFPPLRSLETTPNNLVAHVNSFVDREEAMAQLPTLIASHRLVTLLGAGGIGKTRLSLQVAAAVLDQFADGVWFVDLSSLSQPPMVAQALAAVLSVREADGAPVHDALMKHLRTRRLLVVLDNCEHLVDACAAVVRAMLEAGAGVKVLASSREVLRLDGEHIFHVPSLAAPDPQQIEPALLAPGRITSVPITPAPNLPAPITAGTAPAGTALTGITPAPNSPVRADAASVRADAVLLFFDRARAAQPALRIDAAAVRAAAHICHRLDGLPLAIELAAARTRALSVQAIADRIEDRFRVLGRADRTHLPRQQTLRALIDWSYDLLPASEQRLLQRLSVFAGGWTLVACEAVCAGGRAVDDDLGVDDVGADDIDADDIVDLLTALVEKSLVVAQVDNDRYRLLDTVRHYAREKLEGTGTAAAAWIRDRHRDHWVAFAEGARPELAGPQQAEWLARLDAERDNLVAAHAWSLRSADEGEAALRLAHALRPYWFNRGRPALGMQFTLEALERTGPARRDLLRCKALYSAGDLAFAQGDFHAAREHMGASLELAQALGEARWAAGVRQMLGMACLGDGDAAAADELLVEGLRLARGLGDKRELAAACNALAQLRRMNGRVGDAEQLYRESLALTREIDDHESIAVALLNLAMVGVMEGRTHDARAMLLEVLAIDAETGSMPIAQSALDVACGLAAAVGEHERAARLLGAIDTQGKRTGLVRDPADEAFFAPLVERARAALDPATFERVRREGAGLALAGVLAEVRGWLAAPSSHAV